MTGWIKLHRKLYDNPRSSDHEWLAVWIYLLAHAAYEPTDVIFKGKRITLQPGQLASSVRIISKHTGVNRSKVERVLNVLKIETQIETQTGNLNSLISVNNWEKFQDTETVIETPVRHERDTSETPVRHRTRIKEDKKIRNKEEEIPLPLFDKNEILEKVGETAEAIIETQSIPISPDLKKEERKIPAEKKEEITVQMPWESEAFGQAWEAWERFKWAHYKFKFKTAESLQAALKHLAEIAGGDEATAIKIIQMSLANQWQGLFALDNNKKTNKQINQHGRKGYDPDELRAAHERVFGNH